MPSNSSSTRAGQQALTQALALGLTRAQIVQGVEANLAARRQTAQDRTEQNAGWERRTNGAPQGVSARAAHVGVQSRRARLPYIEIVPTLAPDDSAGRETLKSAARAKTPPEVRASLEKQSPGLGPRRGSGGTANRTNPRATAAANRLGGLGRAAGGIGILTAGIDIARSDDKARAVGANVGAFGLGLAGGEIGASVGLLGGPFAPVTAPLGGLIGSGVGGLIGYQLGGGAVDYARSEHPGIYDIFGATH